MFFSPFAFCVRGCSPWRIHQVEENRAVTRLYFHLSKWAYSMIRVIISSPFHWLDPTFRVSEVRRSEWEVSVTITRENITQGGGTACECGNKWIFHADAFIPLSEEKRENGARAKFSRFCFGILRFSTFFHFFSKSS